MNSESLPPIFPWRVISNNIKYNPAQTIKLRQK